MLSYLSQWEDNIWIGWDLGIPPPELADESDLLLVLLQGKSPVKEGTRDKRGWGSNSGTYSSTEGYKKFQATPGAAPNPAIWKLLWENCFIPKIDMFCWTMAHNSILTGENLKKRGMEGPSRCSLCKMETETTDHLISDCNFSKEVWAQALRISPSIIHPTSIQELLSSWGQLSPFLLSKKPLLQAAWNWILKAICWKIWTERNSRIFRGKESHPSRVAAQARAIVGEALVPG